MSFVRRCWMWFLLAPLVFPPAQTFSRQIDWNYAIILRGTYITTSKLFPNPDALTPDLRAETVPIDGMKGGGVEFRIPLPDQNFYFALSVDYVSKASDQSQLFLVNGALRQLPVREGLRFIPVEISANAYIPLGSETFRLRMGAGVGAYYAERTYSVAGVSAKPTTRPYAYGINVGIGMEYKLYPGVSLSGEVKFRDPEIQHESRFEQDSAEYEGNNLVFSQDPIKSKINVDGMGFSLGVMIELR